MVISNLGCRISWFTRFTCFFIGNIDYWGSIPILVKQHKSINGTVSKYCPMVISNLRCRICWFTRLTMFFIGRKGKNVWASMWLLWWQMDPRQERPFVQWYNLWYNQRRPELHNTWKAWHWLSILEMETKSMQSSKVWASNFSPTH